MKLYHAETCASTVFHLSDVKSLLAFFGAWSLFRMFRPGRPANPGVFAGQTWTARVVRVVDGDTLWVAVGDGRLRIRLAHIDAPEAGQDWSDEASAWLAQVTPLDSKVILKPVELDQYGRVVADLYTRNWHGAPKAWVNFWLVRNGLAWALPGGKNKDVAEAQLAAQKTRLGIWSQSYPTPPWVFRHTPALHSAN